MTDRPCILEFDRVTVRAQPPQTADMESVSFRLHAGEVMMVRLEEAAEDLPLADAAEGLAELEEGTVRFHEEDWVEMHPHRQCRARGQIGRVFATTGWISNLDLVENLCLAPMHHSRRHVPEIVEDALRWARRFGLSEIPGVRPSRAGAVVLRKLEWVRALMGSPTLLILERPTFGVPRTSVPPLVEAVAETAGRGAAVLWVTADDRDWAHDGLPPAARYEMRGSLMVPATGERV